VSPLLVKRQNRLASTASDQLSEVENQAPIKMTDELKNVLEQDFYKVSKKKVLSNLPASINVASVLEDYVRHYAATCLVNYEKQISKTYYTANRKESTRELLGKVLDSINIAKEIADGLRVIFDFNLRAILLYGSHGEVKQYNEVMKPGKVQKRTSISPHLPIKKEEPSVARSSRRQSINTTMESAAGISSKSSTTSSQSTVPGSNPGSSLNPPAASPTTPQAIQVLRDLQEWRLVPDSIYRDSAKKPLESLVYGPIHLLRLFVKLPEIIGMMNSMPVKKKKLVLKYMDSVLEYLQSHHQDFFQ